MRPMTFRGGIHPPEMKNFSAGAPIKTLPPPEIACIPLSQHTGAPAEPLVKKGDKVKAGQKIGEASGFVSSPVHASIPGRIAGIRKHPHPTSGSFESIIIELEGEERAEEVEKHPDFENMRPAEITAIIKEAGVVGLGGACFPTAVKLSPPGHARIDTLIINGAECEPYLSSDHRLMLEHAPDIVTGSRILARALSLERCIIAVEANKRDAAEKLAEAARGIEIAVLPVKYPQGGEKQLIYALMGREVPSGGLPMDAGAVVQNAGTAFAVKEAVVDGKPLTERIVCVTGENIRTPGNLRVRIGTPFKDLVEFCGGFRKPPEKILAGGPMMGIAQYTLEAPVIKGTGGLLALLPRAGRRQTSLECIRCGSCVEACPAGLVPSDLARFAKKEAWAEFENSGLGDCIECGSCSYVCPSAIPIVHYIKYAKARATQDN